jgi:hypothetical protein
MASGRGRRGCRRQRQQLTGLANADPPGREPARCRAPPQRRHEDISARTSRPGIVDQTTGSAAERVVRVLGRRARRRPMSRRAHPPAERFRGRMRRRLARSVPQPGLAGPRRRRPAVMAAMWRHGRRTGRGRSGTRCRAR